MRRRSFPFAVLGLFSSLLFLSTAGAADLTLALANSTCGVVKQVGALYTERTGQSVEYICKSSGRLAKGLKGQAIQADLFLSANQAWMDFMVEGGLAARERVSAPWSNSLVVAAPAGSPLRFDDWRALADDGVARVMIGDPGTAPFGRYAKQALKATGLWSQVRGRIETKKHISLLAERLAAADDATVGILYRTNVVDGLKVLATVEDSLHDPIRYFVAPLRGGVNGAAAEAFLELLRGAEARAIFEAAGFGVADQ